MFTSNGLVALAHTAEAQTATQPALREAVQQRKENVKQAVTEKREAVKTAVGERREAVKAAVDEQREALKNAATGKQLGRWKDVDSSTSIDTVAAKAAQTEFKANLEKEREVFKQKVETARDEFKQKREAAKTELKAKLEKIKDERKKQTVERLDNRFTEINTKQTNHLLNTLTRLEELLGKVSSRADKAAANGKDVSVARTAIEKAKTAIASARTALEAQLKKTYTIQVTDETGLKSAVAVAREALNKDLKAAREAVRTAHKAVVEATKSLKGVPKVDDESAPTTAPATEVPANTETAPVTQ